MKDASVKLPKPPIIEAVLDIDCDLPPGQELAGLEKAARDTFRAAYPKLRTQFVHQVEFSAKPGTAPESAVRSQRVQAFQFLTQDEKQLVQIRAQGFSFNKLTPYTTLDDYLPEIERTWTAYRALASPLQVRAVRLRYINRILLPLTDGKCKLDDYLEAAPQLPDEERLALTGFATQRAAIEKDTGHQINIVMTAQKPNGDRLPIILDICVMAPGPGDPADWAWLTGRIVAIRRLCNRIFEESVTESCLSLFQ
jgi:uncharacterized protein (TIGR04255 family)